MLDHAKLQAEAKKRGWTQAELARRADMTIQQWNDLANGRKPNPNTWTLQRVAQAIGCNVADLLNQERPPTKPQGKQREKGQSP